MLLLSWFNWLDGGRKGRIKQELKNLLLKQIINNMSLEATHIRFALDVKDYYQIQDIENIYQEQYTLIVVILQK